MDRAGRPEWARSASPANPCAANLPKRLRAHAATHWPQAGELEFRYRGPFVYGEAHLPDGTTQPLIRLRYGGSAWHWGFGLYLASSDRYENQIPPFGLPRGSPKSPRLRLPHLPGQPGLTARTTPEELPKRTT